jgi:hemerythrin
MDAKYLLGLVEQDSQHTYFFALLAKVERACVLRNQEGISILLGELLRYTEFHFASEEALMAAYGYPSDGHKAEHAMLLARVRSMLNDQDFQPGSLRLFLYNWATNHIDMEDRDLAAFVLRARAEVQAKIQQLLAE